MREGVRRPPLAIRVRDGGHQPKVAVDMEGNGGNRKLFRMRANRA